MSEQIHTSNYTFVLVILASGTQHVRSSVQPHRADLSHECLDISGQPGLLLDGYMNMTPLRQASRTSRIDVIYARY